MSVYEAHDIGSILFVIFEKLPFYMYQSRVACNDIKAFS